MARRRPRKSPKARMKMAPKRQPEHQLSDLDPTVYQGLTIGKNKIHHVESSIITRYRSAERQW